MIVNEISKGIHIFELLFHFILNCFKLAHISLLQENILRGEIHREVQNTLQIVLVISNMSHIFTKDLSNSINTRGFFKLLPKLFGYILNRVYPETIELKVVNKILDPLLKSLPDPRILLVEIGQLIQSAVLHVPLITHVGAVWMVMLSLVERTDH